MIKRPLNSQFSDKAKDEIKITTIRDKAWPVGVPIMLYNWSGAAYRSKQIDVCAVEVLETQPITITHAPGGMVFSVLYVANRPLFGTEGFKTPADLDAWFSKVVKPGESVTKHLMRFKKLEVQP